MSEATAVARRVLLILAACFALLPVLGFYLWFVANEAILVFAASIIVPLVLLVVGLAMPNK